VPYYDEIGNEFNPNMVPMPQLCLSGKKRDDLNEEMLCNLNRLDQQGMLEFKCFANDKIEK
jgi:hypothetical protein